MTCRRSHRLRPIAVVAAASLQTSAFAGNLPTLEWTRSWNGPNNHADHAIATLILPDGSILVAGDAYEPFFGAKPVLLRYDQKGNLLWSIVEQSHLQIRRMILSSTGDVLLTGYVFRDNSWKVFVRRVNPAQGATVWEQTHSANMIAEFGPAVAEDPTTGEVLVAATDQNDFLVARYSLADGSFIDAHTYDGPQHTTDQATAVAPLPNGGFVVAGNEGNMAHGYRTIAYAHDGSILWSDHENGPIGNTFTPAWVGVDSGGNVLVGGGPETTCGVFEFSAWKINPSGRRIWTIHWPTASCASAEPSGFAIGSDGSIALAGFTGGSIFDIAVLHVDADGNSWVRTWDSPVHSIDRGTAVAIDPAGNVLVAGEATISNFFAFAAVAWTPAGDLLFARTDSIIPNAHDITAALAIDAARGFAIVGSGFTSTENNNVLTAWYTRPLLPGDATGDGLIDINDVLAVINGWGPCPATGSCLADFNQSGNVDIDDLLIVINGWT
jgi:hypothetical protein